MQINQQYLNLYKNYSTTAQNDAAKSDSTEETTNIQEVNTKNVEDIKEIILGTDDEEKEAEKDNAKAEALAVEPTMQFYLEQLKNNQLVAQMNSTSFVKMITDTTDIAGKEIYYNYSSVLDSKLMAESVDIDEIKSIIDEALCKLEIQYTLSNAALQANDIIEQMKAAGVDDSEIRELFENYGNNMDTTIGQGNENSKDGKKISTNKGKNVSKTASNSDVDDKITKLKKRIQEEKSELKNKNLSPKELVQTEVKLEADTFLLDMYQSIKEAVQPLNKDLWSKITSLFS